MSPQFLRSKIGTVSSPQSPTSKTIREVAGRESGMRIAVPLSMRKSHPHHPAHARVIAGGTLVRIAPVFDRDVPYRAVAVQVVIPRLNVGSPGPVLALGHRIASRIVLAMTSGGLHNWPEVRLGRHAIIVSVVLSANRHATDASDSCVPPALEALRACTENEINVSARGYYRVEVVS